MSNLWKITELKKPGFFEKLFGKLPKENIILEINNLLASKPLVDITPQEILTLSTKYNVNLIRKFRTELKNLYSQLLLSCLRDGDMDESELDQLRHLQMLLMLKDTEVREIFSGIASFAYGNIVRDALADFNLSEQEKERLNILKSKLLLSEDTAFEIQRKITEELLQKRLSEISSDERISDDEWNEFQSLMKRLNSTGEFKGDTLRLIEDYRFYWMAEYGQLPNIHVSLNLQKEEYCHFFVPCDWHEMRTVTKSIRYGGPSVSFRIARGVYYRTGRVSAERITEDQLKKLDSGTLYITNKRLIFVGENKSTNIRIGRIMSFTPYKDGVEISKDSGKNPYFLVKQHAVRLHMILNRVLQEN